MGYTKISRAQCLAIASDANDLTGRLFKVIQVPKIPFDLHRILLRTAAALATVQPTLRMSDSEAIEDLQSASNEIAEVIGSRIDSGGSIVFYSPSNLRGQYKYSPLYGALQRNQAFSDYEKNMLWLLGLLIIARVTTSDGRNSTDRYCNQCMAVRAIGEKSAVCDETGAALISYLTPVLGGTRSPRECLESAFRATNGKARREHIRLIIGLLKDVQGVPRQHRRRRGGGKTGYQEIRGEPRGLGVTVRLHSPNRRISGFSPEFWWAADKSPDAEEQEGGSRSGEAPGEAATPGEIWQPPEDDDVAVPHYNRNALHLAGRAKVQRARSRGQDTLTNLTVWTPHEMARVVKSLMEELESEEPERRSAAALSLIVCVTGIPVDTSVRCRVTSNGGEQLGSTGGMSISPDGWMQWTVPSNSQAARPGTKEGRDLVRRSGTTVTVPLPGLLQMVLPILETDHRPRSKLTPGLQASIESVFRGGQVQSASVQGAQRNWWGWVAKATQQPTTASLMTGQFRPSAMIPSWYTLIEAEKQIEAYSSAYRLFTEALEREFRHQNWSWNQAWSGLGVVPTDRATGAIGSRIVPKDCQIKREISNRVLIGDGASEHYPRPWFDQLNLALYHIVTLCAGIRAVRIRPALVSLVIRGIRVLSDKDTEGFAKARLVTLPERLEGVVKTIWREREKELISYSPGMYRPLRQEPPFLPRGRPELVTELKVNRRSPIGFLSYSHGHSDPVIAVLSPSEIQKLKQADLPLPLNWQRHWLRTKFVENGASDQVINSKMGHACLGQDPYGPDSCISVRAASDEVDKLIENDVADIFSVAIGRIQVSQSYV